MKDNKCSKGFPKPFIKETLNSGNAYPQYRKSPEDGVGSFKYKMGDNNIQIDNGSVVPYNHFLPST